MLEPTTVAALITTAPPTILSILTLLISIHNKYAIKELHVIVNSRLTELLKSTGEEQHAAGRREGLEARDVEDHQTGL
jgi:hypothetical protein